MFHFSEFYCEMNREDQMRWLVLIFMSSGFQVCGRVDWSSPLHGPRLGRETEGGGTGRKHTHQHTHTHNKYRCRSHSLLVPVTRSEWHTKPFTECAHVAKQLEEIKMNPCQHSRCFFPHQWKKNKD